MQNNNRASEVLYWLFHEQSRWAVGQPKSSLTRLEGRPIVIVGANAISSRLAFLLSSFGWKSWQVVDEVRLRNPRFINDDGSLRGDWPVECATVLDYREWETKIDHTTLGCVVSCSDTGDVEAVRGWNRFCIERKICFFPLVLQNLIGNVGPFVVPGETACYECVYARQNSHLQDSGSQRIALSLLTKGQSATGLHGAMASLISDIAACELFKLYRNVLPERNIGKLILADLFNTQMKAHKVLKVPRCLVCSPLHAHSSVTAYRPSPPPRDLADT